MTVVTEETAGGRVVGELSSDALTEPRSSDQVVNDTSSTSPPFWDIDDSDDDRGCKPHELYGKYTWKIEKFSENTHMTRSNEFEVGGYKWYILNYPRGCNVSTHLSSFLCVADDDKFLSGSSIFTMFTIVVVNKDPKKTKYSDTVHRFWKKELDWGWKKFVELSKLSDGFVNDDTLILKVQVQVIRDKVDRPFRCLDSQYRRELVRVYLMNVEAICWRYIAEKRGKLEKLVEDEAKWSSFCAFWQGMGQSTRRNMAREKKDTILKAVVKTFFVEKEMTSTLVMDSLHSGLKALEAQSRSKKGKAKLLEAEETPPPLIRIEKDMFVLVDDVLLLLKKAAIEPLPAKDDKGQFQTRNMDGGFGEVLRRLTELGRKTLEFFVLGYVFRITIEAAFQEAVALNAQEELIREEEATLRVTKKKQSVVKKSANKGRIK